MSAKCPRFEFRSSKHGRPFFANAVFVTSFLLLSIILLHFKSSECHLTVYSFRRSTHYGEITRSYLFIRDSESIVDFLEVNGWFTLDESFEPAVSLRLVKHHVDRKS